MDDRYSVALDGKIEQVDPQIYVDIFKKNCEIFLEAKRLIDEYINGSDK